MEKLPVIPTMDRKIAYKYNMTPFKPLTQSGQTQPDIFGEIFKVKVKLGKYFMEKC